MSGKNTAKITQDELKIKEARAVTLRHEYGMTYEAIAQELGYTSVSGAYKAYQNGIKNLVVEKPEEARMADLRRLDTAIELLMARLKEGDIKVIEPLLRVMERRSKFLGLDTPIKIQQDVTTWEGGDSIDRAVRELAALLQSNDPNSQSAIGMGADTGKTISDTTAGSVEHLVDPDGPRMGQD